MICDPPILHRQLLALTTSLDLPTILASPMYTHYFEHCSLGLDKIVIRDSFKHQVDIKSFHYRCVEPIELRFGKSPNLHYLAVVSKYEAFFGGCRCWIVTALLAFFLRLLLILLSLMAISFNLCFFGERHGDDFITKDGLGQSQGQSASLRLVIDLFLKENNVITVCYMYYVASIK